MEQTVILDAYARNGMCISAAAAELHYDRRTVKRKLLSAGRSLGIDPFDFYDLAEYLLTERRLHGENSNP